jgi:hypothetical protein
MFQNSFFLHQRAAHELVFYPAISAYKRLDNNVPCTLLEVLIHSYFPQLTVRHVTLAQMLSYKLRQYGSRKRN